MAEGERVYKENEIASEFGKAYDHEKVEKGYADDANNVGANRLITNWYLTRKTDLDPVEPESSDPDEEDGTPYDPELERKRTLSIHRRVPLPLKTQSLKGYVLHGELEPSNNDEGKARNGRTISVVLTKLATWVFDRTKSNRGIWVTTGICRGWYRLKVPSSDPVSLQTTITLKEDTNGGVSDSPKKEAALPSQETLHLPLRARLGLLSNLVDLLSEPYGGSGDDEEDEEDDDVTHNYVPIHAKRSPEAIHALLSPSPDILQEHDLPEQPLNAEPFDLDLLRVCPGFVKHHLDSMHTLLDSESVFMSELARMEEARLAKSRDSSPEGTYCDDDSGWTDEEYRASAEGAEKRGRRTPWGEMIPGEEGKVRPNRLIDIEIQRAAKLSQQPIDKDVADEEMQDFGDDDSDDSDEDDAEGQPWKKKAVNGSRNRVLDEEDEEEEEDEAVNGNTNIPGVDPDLDPFGYFVVKPEPDYSPEAMVAALKELTKYLTPEPSGADLDSETYNDSHGSKIPAEFAISEDNISIFVEEFIQRNQMPSLEAIILATEAIRKSQKKVMKSMFKASKVHPMSPGKVVFDKWLDIAILLVTKTRPCAVLLMTSIINLICDFNVIKGSKQLGLLKSKFSVDWVACVAKARICAERNDLSSVIEACDKAQQHLDGMIKDGPIAAKRPAAVILAKATGSALTNGATSPTTAGADAGKSAEELAKEKQAKEEKDNLRRQRMAQMLKKAKISYGSAGKSGDTKPANDDATETAASPSKPTESAKAEKEPASSGRGAKESNKSGGWDKSSGATTPPRESGWESSRRDSSSRPPRGSSRESTPPPSRDAGSGWGSSSGKRPPPRESRRSGPHREDSRSSGGWGSDSRDAPRRSSGGWGDHDNRPDYRGHPREEPRRSSGNWDDRDRRPDARGSDVRDAPRRSSSGWGDRGTDDRGYGRDAGPPPDRTDYASRRADDRGYGRDAGPPPDRNDYASGRPDDRGYGRDAGQPPDRNAHSSGQRHYDDRRGSGYENRPPQGPPQAHDRRQKRDRGEDDWGDGRQHGEVSRPQDQELRRPEPDMKRRRFDDRPPAQRAPVPPMGRGRGRGKDANLPSWMTRGDGPAPAAAPDQQPQSDFGAAPAAPPVLDVDVAAIADAVALATAAVPSNPPPAPIPTHAPMVMPRTNSTPPPMGRGRGRGREANKPAWMTRGSDSTVSAAPQDAATAAAAPPPAPLPAAAPPSMARGRGAKNVPAWMTRGADSTAGATYNANGPAGAPAMPEAIPAQPLVPGEALSGDQSADFKAFMASQQGPGRGRGGRGGGGRGRGGRGGRGGYDGYGGRGGRGPPPSAPAPAPSMGRGRGRGRGKDLNKPAWMTNQ